MSEKVLVGLSGGVDSAVAAYLLKKQGYEVTCCFMRNWDSIANGDILGNPTLDGSKCSQELDYDDAVETAFELDLPIIRKDFIEEYYDEVFNSFLETYKRGYTPNPDVFCNKFIKFGHFAAYANSLGFDHIAMGHYALRIDENGESHLYKAYDKNKDQSYFLGQITSEQLSYCLFPLCSLTKPEVRKIAENLSLSVAKKKDSTGVCFIGERHFKEFLSNYLPSQEGDIVDINDGTVLKKHDGILYYTIGQHRGLDIGGISHKSSEPYFVVGKNLEQNILYVAKEDTPFRFSYHCHLSDFNWIGKDKPVNSYNCKAKFRYRGQDLPVTLRIGSSNDAYLDYNQGIAYVAKGQICCLYQGERLVASGVIDVTYDRDEKPLKY